MRDCQDQLKVLWIMLWIKIRFHIIWKLTFDLQIGKKVKWGFFTLWHAWTLNYTIRNLMTLRKTHFENVVWKGENKGKIFFQIFCTPSKPNFNFWLALIQPSANAFNLDWSTIVTYPKKFNSTTLYHTILTFNWERNYKLFEILWEKEKMMVTSIFTFLTQFSTLSKTKIIILAIFILSSAKWMLSI